MINIFGIKWMRSDKYEEEFDAAGRAGEKRGIAQMQKQMDELRDQTEREKRALRSEFSAEMSAMQRLNDAYEERSREVEDVHSMTVKNVSAVRRIMVQVNHLGERKAAYDRNFFQELKRISDEARCLEERVIDHEPEVRQKLNLDKKEPV